MRPLDGLINADWLDDDTVIGALFNDDGQVETAHIDLPNGDLVADGFVVDPIPEGAWLTSGKERVLLLFRNGTDASLNQFDPRTQRRGPTISVDDLFGQSISRTGHRIAAGTERGVEIYDGFTGQQVDTIPGDDLRGVFITVTDQLYVGVTRRRAHPPRPRQPATDPHLRWQPRLHHPGGRHRRRDADRDQRRRPQRHRLRRRQRRAHRHTDHYPRRRVQPDHPVARRPLAGRRRRGRRRLSIPPRSGTSTRSTGRPPHAASPAATSHAKSGPPTSAHWRHIGRRAPTCRLTADRRLPRRWLATPEPKPRQRSSSHS